MIKVLVVGQTPPPYHGQAIMISKILEAQHEGVELYHVRMHFSKEVDELGKFSPGKALHLIGTILRIFYYRFRYHIKILYYPPAGPEKNPVIRDLIILLCTRFLFKGIIFHFHAAGLSTLENSLSPFVRYLFQRAYFFPDIAIRLSTLNPEDGRFLHAKKDIIVPYGIEDHALQYAKNRHEESSLCHLLYVGMVKESKGILILLDACHVLKERGMEFRLTVIGGFSSPDFQQDVMDRVSKYQLSNKIAFAGVLTGEKKYAAYNQADIFCYPTFYEHESFGIVLLEAMQFSLPIVATKWRGVASVVQDGVTGFCVPIQDSIALADKLESFILDPDLGIQMGKKGREAYLSSYSTEIFQSRMQAVFLSLASQLEKENS